MDSRQLLEQYGEAWKWGYRCDSLLQDNKHYIEQSEAERNKPVEKPKKSLIPHIKFRLPHI
jgi:hypothetical protein